MKLTVAAIEKLQIPEKPRKHYDDEVRPLFLKITPTGRKGWYVHLKLPNGKYTDHKLGDYVMYTPKEARQEALEKLIAVRKGTDVVQRKKRDEAGTLQGFLDKRYRAWIQQNHKDSTNTLRVLEKAFNDFRYTPLEDITVSIVEEWRLKRLKENTSKGTKVLPQTVNRQCALLKACLEKARLWGIVPVNSLADLKPIRVEKKPVEFLDDKQIGQLMRALERRDKKKFEERREYNKWKERRGLETVMDIQVELESSSADYLSPLVILVLKTGMRFGEAINMRWSHISEDNVLTVYSGKTGGFRYVPLQLDAQLALMHWRRIHKHVTRDTKGLEDVVWITMDRGGKPRPLRSVKTSWGNVTQTLPFHCDFKALRRTFGASLAREGTAIYTISKLLGHSNVATTESWYVNLGLDEYREAVALLDSVQF